MDSYQALVLAIKMFFLDGVADTQTIDGLPGWMISMLPFIKGHITHHKYKITMPKLAIATSESNTKRKFVRSTGTPFQVETNKTTIEALKKVVSDYVKYEKQYIPKKYWIAQPVPKPETPKKRKAEPASPMNKTPEQLQAEYLEAMNAMPPAVKGKRTKRA